MCSAACLRFVCTPDVIVEEFPWGPHEWLVCPTLTASKELMLVRVIMPPGAAHQFHRHTHFEEAVYCIEGRLQQWVGEESHVLRAGEVAHVPRNIVHGSYNIFDEPCTFLAMLASREFLEPSIIDVFREEPWCTHKTPIDY